MQTLSPARPSREADGVAARPGTSLLLLPEVGRRVLMAITIGIYLGAMPYLILLSPLLLYGTYLAIIVPAGMVMVCDETASRQLRWVAPYLVWVTFYCYWGALVAPAELPLADAFKVWIKTMLVIGGLALAVSGVNSLRHFANGVQVGALINAGIALWEVWHPELIVKLARANDPMATAFNVERPGGLWSNPDVAAFGYLFALLVSCWGRGPLIVAGRLACLVGIYLSASRTGAYVLVLGCAILLVARLAHGRWRPGTAGMVALGMVAALGVAIAAVKVAPAGTFDASNHRQLMRFADVFETDARRIGDPSRVEIAQAAAMEALDGPWYGQGIFTFQMEPRDRFAALNVGAHNLYITVWGETGIPGALLFFALLAYGLSRLADRSLPREDQVRLFALWLGYMVIALTWHNQFTSFEGMVYSGALWHLPGVLGRADMKGR